MMKQSRRSFIQASGILLGASTANAAPPIAELASLLLGAATSRGEDADVVDRNYLNINLFGSPNRWVFDQFLKTKASETINAAPMVSTRLSATNGSYTDAEYATVDYKGVQVPPVWMTQVRSGSGSRSMSELLEHMIVFRGFGSGVDGHPGNLVKQFLPLPSAGSTTGNMADHSGALMKAIQFPSGLSSTTAFASPKGLGASAIGYGGPPTNAIRTLMNPFIKRPENNNLEMMRTRYKDLVGLAQGVLNQHASNSAKQIASVQSDQEKALKTLREGLEDLDSAWAGLFGKYKNVVEGSFRDRAAGFSDLPIPGNDDGTSGEMKTSIISGNVFFPPSTFDIRNTVNEAQLDVMAQSFALAEFVFTRGLTNAMEIGQFDPNNLKSTFSRDNAAGKYAAPIERVYGYQFDEHNTGAVSSVFLSSCLYRALGAGMAELVSVLKAKDLFKKTVIHVCSEFGRAPRDSGGGSDHGFDSMVASVFTGMRTGGPLVLGNINRSGTNGIYGANYAGTFGWKAPTNIQGSGTTFLQPGHVASSIAVLLGYKHNPWTNTASPLLYLDNGNAIGKASGDIV